MRDAPDIQQTVCGISQKRGERFPLSWTGTMQLNQTLTTDGHRWTQMDTDAETFQGRENRRTNQ
jgi:hypothetical protein